MIRENFYTGEPIPMNGSPPNSSIYTTEQEAIQNAGFGAYNYEPTERIMAPASIYPGGYGYNQQQYYGGYGYNVPPQNPYSYDGYQQQNVYGPNAPNPAFAFQQSYPQSEQKRYITIQALNPSGSDYLPNENFHEEIDKLRMEFWQAQEEEYANSCTNNQYGYNYYGVPYGNPYYGNQAYIRLSQRVQQMKDEARENRIKLNIHLSKIAHNYSGIEYNEQDIEDMYRGKQIEMPQEYYQEATLADRFSRMVPFDNSQMYRAYDAKVSEEFHKIIPADADMQTTFRLMNVVNTMWELEEERHRRKNGAALYNSEDGSYRYFVRAKAAERRLNKNREIANRTIIRSTDNCNYDYGNHNPSKSNIDPDLFPILSQSATLSEDGVLNISCNFGASRLYSVHNSEEAEYEDHKKRFEAFVNSIPGAIYLGDDKSSNPSSGGADDG